MSPSWGGYAAHYIVRARVRITHVVQTVNGPRRVKRWGKWVMVKKFTDSSTATAYHDAFALNNPTWDSGVFLREKKIHPR